MVGVASHVKLAMGTSRIGIFGSSHEVSAPAYRYRSSGRKRSVVILFHLPLSRKSNIVLSLGIRFISYLFALFTYEQG